MKKSSALIYIGVAAAAFALGIVVSGPLHWLVHRGGPFPEPPGGRGLEIARLLEKDLDLTAEQSRKIREIIENNMKQEHLQREKIRRTLDRNIGILEGDAFDENRTRAMIRSLDHVEEEIKVMHIKQLYEIRDVLTPSQRGKFTEMRNKRMGVFSGGPPRGGPDMPGGPGPGMHEGPGSGMPPGPPPIR
ncbi:MAG TPA: Spy/CpxP family protein refolding chaperone [Spirochaetota bacterium]|nr:Spy/CpxP family protein refolding chaperone [Spirochaetota bacterium]